MLTAVAVSHSTCLSLLAQCAKNATFTYARRKAVLSAERSFDPGAANDRLEPIVQNAAQSPHIRFGQYAELETEVSLRVVTAGLAREFIPERAERGACT